MALVASGREDIIVSSDRRKAEEILDCLRVLQEVQSYIMQGKRDPLIVVETLKPIIDEPKPKLSGAVVLLYSSMTIGEKAFCREAMSKALSCECGDPIDGCHGTCDHFKFDKHLEIWNGERISSKSPMYKVMLRAFRFAMHQNSALQQIVINRLSNLI